MKTVFRGGPRFDLLPVNALSKEMNRWFDGLQSENQGGQVPVSIWETETHFHLEFDMPGVEAGDVEVQFVDDVLQVTSNRTQEAERNYLRQERRFGTSERRFTLPVKVDENQIEAELKNGILGISIAKAPEAQVKKIDIKQS